MPCAEPGKSSTGLPARSGPDGWQLLGSGIETAARYSTHNNCPCPVVVVEGRIASCMTAMTNLRRATDQKVLTSTADINDAGRGRTPTPLSGRRTSRLRRPKRAGIELTAQLATLVLVAGDSGRCCSRGCTHGRRSAFRAPSMVGHGTPKPSAPRWTGHMTVGEGSEPGYAARPAPPDRRAGHPRSMMERWHRQIRCHLFGPEHFVTAQMLQLDTTTGRVQWVNAGHPPPILVREHRVAQRLVAPTALPVGLGGSEPRVSELGLAPGTESSASPTEWSRNTGAAGRSSARTS